MSKSADEKIAQANLGQAFRRKEFAPVYLLYGEEDFLIDEAIDRLDVAGVVSL